MQKKIENIPTSVMKGLTTWDWPGNIRELENFIERAVILTRGKSLEAPLGELLKTTTEQPMVRAPQEPGRSVLANEFQTERNVVADEYVKRKRDEIVNALIACKGRVSGADGAAARLGINRSTLVSRMRNLGIYPKRYA
jgi:transcriptional regulator with GAF, ATPase, and Fis domain